ncbi:MAG: hypothetical protein E6Q97_22020 [Desulfurellales bacterium]|nr:MAG: hypothetical protein E6Q97_22020 [Desulfurellales bacterium]
MTIATKIVEVSEKLTKLHQAAGLDVEVMAGLDHVAVFSASKADAQASAKSIAESLTGKVEKLGSVVLSFDDEWMARIAVEW